MMTLQDAIRIQNECSDRIDMAIKALDGIAQLFESVSDSGDGRGTADVGGENMACLLGLIIGDMKSAQKSMEDVSFLETAR